MCLCCEESEWVFLGAKVNEAVLLECSVSVNECLWAGESVCVVAREIECLLSVIR